MLRDLKRKVYGNFHVFLGILIGLYVSTLLSAPQCRSDVLFTLPKNGAGITKLELNTPTYNISRKVDSSKKTKPIRPR